MIATPTTITFDCTNPRAQADFWSAVTGHPVDEQSNQFAAGIGMWPRAQGRLALLFLAVPEGKTAKNRVHLDLTCDNRSAEIEKLVGLGATHVGDHDEWGVSWSVLRDPEGNEFCVADAHE